MKLGILIKILLLGITLQAAGQAQPREVISLNGSWNFITDEKESGLSSGWNSGLPEKAHQINVPHTWNTMEDYENYIGLAWYQKKIHIPAEWKNKHIRLKFGAVYHDAVIYINGKKAAEHLNSGYTTFYVDISKFVNYGSENTLVVSVSNKYSDTNLPYKDVFDWVNDGGIIRSVDLIASGKPSVRYVHVTPVINFADTSAKALINIRLWEDNVKKAKFNVSINEKKTGKQVFSQSFTLAKKGDEFQAAISLDKVKLWRFDDPFLYQIQVTTQNGADKQVSQFGFRKIELQGRKLLVNNEPVRLPGIEYMPASHPDYGSAEPEWVMDSVMTMFKDLNAAITRFHWQVDEYMLDLMDEKGILVQAEIPWWQQPGRLSPELMETAKKQFAEMIERDYNRPSIFAWGISNEVYGDRDRNQYIELKNYIKQKDSTRLVNVVSNEPFNRKLNDESLIGDLPTWNEYIGTWFGKSSDELPQYFSVMESFLGDRPLLITENGLCEPRFSGGDLRRIDDMLYHYKEWAKRDYVAGCIYFSLNDYRTHKGEDGTGKFKARIHGITDLYFNKKPSYTVFKQLASPVEISNVKKLSNSSVEAELLNKNTLPSYTLENYKISWETTEGKRVSKPLPKMKPGDKISIKIDDVEKRFAFEIISPTGSIVTAYPVIK